MSGIYQNLYTFQYNWCPNSSSICSFFLFLLTLSYFHPEVLIDLVHCGLDLISIHAWIILLLCWFSCEHHPRIHSINHKDSAKLRCFRYSIFCSKLSQRKLLYPITQLVIDEHSQVLFHTSFHSFSLALHLIMERC